MTRKRRHNPSVKIGYVLTEKKLCANTGIPHVVSKPNLTRLQCWKPIDSICGRLSGLRCYDDNPSVNGSLHDTIGRADGE